VDRPPNQAASEFALADLRLQDPERAARNLALIAGRVPAGVANAIQALLPESPDPDTALNLFERLTGQASPEILQLLDRHRTLVHYGLSVLGYSHFLGETLIQNPDIFHVLQRESALDRTFSREDYREAFARFHSRSFDTDVPLLLARFKRREYIRIMLRDTLGIATLAETTAEISALADVLIEEALSETEAELRKRHGAPQHLDTEGRRVGTPIAVLSLGKLGGNELNYSSDIDLLFLYDDSNDAGAGVISNREFFVRVAQGVTDVLSRMTREGSAFRIDLRLRPQGREGEPAVGLRNALRYYAETARDWELQAMIKVRHSAGDLHLARRFIRGVQPFVYTEHINFAAIETALEALDRISARRRHAAARGSTTDVKLDRGGLRDIEFLVQCLQRVYGGKERWLRSGGTLFSLQKLHDKGHISGKDFHELTTAYEFLRRLEHRLQLRYGQQTHRLPSSEEELAILFRSMGEHDPEQRPEGFLATVQRRMNAVSEIYQRVIHQQQASQRQEEQELQLESSSDLGREQSDRQIVLRLSEDSPPLHALATRRDLAPHTRRNLFRFLSSAFTSSERYAAVAHRPDAVERALDLFEVSDFLSDILVRHPEEVGALSELRGLQPENQTEALFGPEDRAAGASADPVFEYLGSASVSLNEKLSLLRRHYRHRIFIAGARDVIEGRRVFDSMAETTAAADEATAAALDIAGHPEGFAILALGRLGTAEFDLLSDADMLFLRDESLDANTANRIAEQVMHALSAYTRDGTAFPVDTRLRPRGSEGELVLTPRHLEEYFLGEAQAWEALSYTKLRFVAGEEELGAAASDAVTRLLDRFAADAGFLASTREMRAKLERAESGFTLKRSPGGIYDIDFVVSSLLVRHGLQHARGNQADRLDTLRGRKLLPEEDYLVLHEAAEFFRAVEHAIRLVTGGTRKSLPSATHAQQAVLRLSSRILQKPFPEGLQPELEARMAATRRVYDHRMK